MHIVNTHDSDKLITQVVMPSRKQSPPGARQIITGKAALDLRRRGLQMFQVGRYSDAIALWSRAPQSDAKLTAARAEAHFRLALSRPTDAERLADLRRAVELRPHELRFQYHLGLALHRTGDLDGAIERYQAVLRQDPTWRGAGLVLALARLEQDPRAELAALPGSAAQARKLAPVQALLRGDMPSAEGDKPIERLWRGLAAIANGDGAARDLLADSRSLPSTRAAAVRRYYHGVVAAQTGDLDGALQDWLHVYRQQMHTPWLRDNLTAALLQHLDEDAGADAAQVAELVREAVGLAAANTALAEPLVRALDRGARVAAERGDWAQATALWEDARRVVSANTGLGSPRPLLHNLALAYEAQARWMDAAEMWRAMLRTRPRKGGDAGQPSDAQWAWVRKRVIECYKRAGAPGEAVAVFRQAIKAAPDDLDVRLQLVDALIANEQEQAAYNEVERILALDPANVDARLRGSALLAARDEFRFARQMLQPVLEQQPQRDDVRRQVAALLLAEGQRALQWFDFTSAERAFQEAQQFAPEDWRPPLNLARIAISQQALERARELLHRVLDLGGDQPDAYLQVIDCWAVAEQMDEVRAAVARAERALPLLPDFFVEVGVMLRRRDMPPPRFGSFLMAPPKREAKETPRSRLAEELLERALGAEPDNGRRRLDLAAQLSNIDPALALRYAEEGARMLPGEPEAQMLLAILQAANERKREAKETLRRGARVARQQGKTALAQQMEDIRRSVDDPMLPLMLQMGPLLDEWEDEDDDLW